MIKKQTTAIPTPMQFVVEGSGELSSAKIPRSVSAMLEVLKRLENGKLLRRRALAARIGKCEGTIDGFTTHPLLSDFKFSKSGISYFGNKTTIAAAKEQFK